MIHRLFFKTPATSQIYTLSLHDALPIWMYAAFTGRRPGREPPLNSTGARLLREHLHDWVEHQLDAGAAPRSEERTSELQSRRDLVCRLLLEKKKLNSSVVSQKV